jgi:hypothetical protein
VTPRTIPRATTAVLARGPSLDPGVGMSLAASLAPFVSAPRRARLPRASPRAAPPAPSRRRVHRPGRAPATTAAAAGSRPGGDAPPAPRRWTRPDGDASAGGPGDVGGGVKEVNRKRVRTRASRHLGGSPSRRVFLVERPKIFADGAFGGSSRSPLGGSSRARARPLTLTFPRPPSRPPPSRPLSSAG